MAAQHSTTTDFSSRYKFNGKELDQETGCYYGVYPENFGRARYLCRHKRDACAGRGV